ncbi:MAG: hypothetical protein NUV77_03835 [Thermoguttaceae bacterium]|jgi:hypothetical protein|nr:hypothetical protein [Thermoguttaceae bacterium]
MTADEAALAVIEALEALQIPYLLSGSFASGYYGIPRSTHDADFVVEWKGKSIRSLMDRLGPRFRLDPQMSFEAVTGTRRFIVHAEGNDFEVELFQLSEDPHDQERFRRRRTVPLLGRHVHLPTVEDVVVTKVRWLMATRRSKDREDARSVIAVCGESIDWDYVYSWCDRHGTRELLDEIRRSIPPI